MQPPNATSYLLSMVLVAAGSQAASILSWVAAARYPGMTLFASGPAGVGTGTGVVIGADLGPVGNVAAVLSALHGTSVVAVLRAAVGAALGIGIGMDLGPTGDVGAALGPDVGVGDASVVLSVAPGTGSGTEL